VWCADRGIGRNPQHPQSDHLEFTRGGMSRAWPFPSDAAQVPQFVSTLLSAVRPRPVLVFPKDGVWSLGRSGGIVAAESRLDVRGPRVRVPAGLRGAVWFNSTDWNELCAMLFLQITLGPSVQIDTIVIPESGNAILYFEQRRVVWVTVRGPGHARRRGRRDGWRRLSPADGANPARPIEGRDLEFPPRHWANG